MQRISTHPFSLLRIYLDASACDDFGRTRPPRIHDTVHLGHERRIWVMTGFHDAGIAGIAILVFWIGVVRAVLGIVQQPIPVMIGPIHRR